MHMQMKTYLFLRLSLSVYENGFLDRCVSPIFEFSGNEFELGKNIIGERKRTNYLLDMTEDP